MKRRASLITLSVLCLAAASASAAGKAPTTVHFTHAIPTGSDGSYFEGSIVSSKKACKNDRKVVVVRRLEDGTEKIGSTQSEKNANLGYKWVLERPEPLMPGTYFAKAPATDECKADKSPDVPVAPS